MRRGLRDERGVVLPLVLIIGLLLTASITTFVRRSVVDKMMVDNRDRSAAAATLARGGVQIAKAVIFQDRYAKQLAQLNGETPAATRADLWARVGASQLDLDWGGELTVRIEDAGARFNLNALVPVGGPEEESVASEEAEELLVEFLQRLIDEHEALQTGERQYEPRELARNLLDYMDADDVAISGRDENEYYLAQDPPYEAPNRPLLSVEEIGMVEGFDVQLAEIMRPYVTVHPLVGDAGINLNTAPPHVLSMLFYGGPGDMRLADADLVTDIVRTTEQNRIVCSETEADPERCVGLSEVGLGVGAIFPPVELPMDSYVFTVVSEARVGEVVYSIEAVIDASDGEDVRLLSWRAL